MKEKSPFQRAAADAQYWRDEAKKAKAEATRLRERNETLERAMASAMASLTTGPGRTDAYAVLERSLTAGRREKQ